MAVYTGFALALGIRRPRRRPVTQSLPAKQRGRPKKPALPLTIATGLHVPKKRGARTKVTTPEVVQWFLAEINSWKTRLRIAGIKAKDSDALRLSIAAHHLKGLDPQLDESTRREEWVTAIVRIRANAVADGSRPPTVARAVFLRTVRLYENAHVAVRVAASENRGTPNAQVLAQSRHLAQAQALNLEHSPVFRRRREYLARLRSAMRQEAY